MSKGLVYILTNPCLDGWVKIEMTERNDIKRRLAVFHQRRHGAERSAR